jgi:hypothetical protein
MMYMVRDIFSSSLLHRASTLTIIFLHVGLPRRSLPHLLLREEGRLSCM